MISTEQLRTAGVFAIVTLLLSIIVARLLQNNYASEEAQYSIAVISTLVDTNSFRLEYLGFEHAHGPLLAALFFYKIPWLRPVAPYAVSVVAAAILVTLWYRQLGERGYTTSQRRMLVALLLLNPALLWSATAGGAESISLLLFYLLYLSSLQMIYRGDIRSFMTMGLVLAGLVYFVVFSIYLLLALLPLLMFVVPIQRLRESPFSVLIIIGMPMMIIGTMWLYLNWIFHGDPLAFLKTYNSAFAGAVEHVETQAWLRDFGGELLLPMLVGLGYTVAGYPVLLFLIWRHYQEKQQLRVPLVLMLFPVIGIGLASWTYFLASPFQITALLLASVMAEIARMDCGRGAMTPLIVLLITGTISSWYLLATDEYSHTSKWVTALQAMQDVSYGGDIQVGHWLAVNRQPTMIDDKSGFRAIVARGDAANLLPPFSHEYRLAVHADRPSVAQIAVPEPDTTRGQHDRINARFPQLYEIGMPGYERVYDENGWRVYRRIN